MALVLLETTNLPLGKRVLSYGSRGRDVKELQEILRQVGFYFGQIDGIFGLLTEEALILLQKTFDLRVDGIVGREVLSLVKKISHKTARIIYTVKKQDRLHTISKKFGVKRSAWRRIPGQGDPNKKIYPGMKILLPEKALFCWDDPAERSKQFNISGFISKDVFIEPDGLLHKQGTDSNDEIRYQLIGAARESWPVIFSSIKAWARLAQDLKKVRNSKFGFDFREAPTDKINCWIGFIKYICKSLMLKELSVLALPLFPQTKEFKDQLFWIDLPLISSLTRLVMVEPVFNIESPLSFEASAAQIQSSLNVLAKKGLAGKTLLIGQTGGWDWNLDQNQVHEIPYKVARIIRAQNCRSAKYIAGSNYTVLYYYKRKERHCLIYRDEKGWQELFDLVIKKNYLGVVIHNFKDLGKAGPDLIAGSFMVQTKNRFESVLD